MKKLFLLLILTSGIISGQVDKPQKVAITGTPVVAFSGTPVVSSSGSTLTISGTILTSTTEITRPSDATAYTALDAIASSSTAPANIQFASVTRVSAGSGYITGAVLRTDQSTNTARFKLHLFTGTVTAINDNAQYTSLYANNSIWVGTISFDACATEGSGGSSAVSLNNNIRIPFVLTSGTSVYGLLETLDAFTPASGQKIFIRLTIDSN